MSSPITTGLLLHLDASQGVTLDGEDRVIYWEDQSGFGNHATSSGTLRPTYSSSNSYFKGEPTVNFSGAEDLTLVKGDLFKDRAEVTILIVMRRTDTTGEQTPILGTTSTGLFRCEVRFNTDYRIRLGGRRLDSDSFASYNPSCSPIYSGNYVYTIWSRFRWSSGNVKYWRHWGSADNGYSSTIFSSGNTENTDSSVIKIGSSNGSRYLIGQIAEIMIFNREITDETELFTIGSYIHNKYHKHTNVASKTYSVGVGGNFTSMRSALEYINSRGEGDYTIDVCSNYDDAGYNGNVSFPERYNVKITCTHNKNSLNDPDSWYTINLTTSDNRVIGLYADSDSGADDNPEDSNQWPRIKIEYLKFSCDPSVTDLRYIHINGSFGYGTSVSRCIFTGFNTAVIGHSLPLVQYSTVLNGLTWLTVYDCLFSNIRANGHISITAAPLRTVHRILIYNNTINGNNESQVGKGYGIKVNGCFNTQVRNCSATNCVNGSFDVSGTEDISYCACDDNALSGIGTGNLNSIVPTDEFISLDPGNRNYFQLKENVLYNAGTLVSFYISEYKDFREKYFEDHPNFPIGAFQLKDYDVNFSGAPTEGVVNLLVRFYDLTVGATSWDWDFGDGSEHSTEQNPTHTYLLEGQYTVSLTASNGTYTDTTSKGYFVLVLSNASVCPLTYSYRYWPKFSYSNLESVGAGINLYEQYLTTNAPAIGQSTFDGADSTVYVYNLSKVTNFVGLVFTVRFTNTRVYDTGLQSHWREVVGLAIGDWTGSSWTYDNVGMYLSGNVYSGAENHIWVRYGYNGTASISPINMPTGVYDMIFKLEVLSVSGSDTTVKYTAIVNRNGSYYNTYGTTRTINRTTFSKAFLFGKVGSAYWNWSNTCTVDYVWIFSPRLGGIPCGGLILVDFYSDNIILTTPGDINFTANTYTYSTITDYSWDFGDGSTPSTEENPTHTYDRAGYYTVELSVTTADGTESKLKSDYIEVELHPDFSVDEVFGTYPLTVQFTDLSTGNPSAWDWDFGDGTPHSSDQNPSHIYAVPGKYTVTLIASVGTYAETEIKDRYIRVVGVPYSPGGYFELTHDTDEGRINSSPNIVALSTGQQVAFYSKFLTTGKQSYSRITFTPPSFTVNVEAGNGSINGVLVAWDSGALTATPDSYQIVYVDALGEIGIGENLSMTFIKDVIILALVSSGASSITRINELEHTGNYVYVKRQVYTGSEWVWDDYETILNTGEEPKGFYDSSSDEIYLMYKKDSISYTRRINPLNELTWEFLPNVNISTNQINLNRNPENTIKLALVSSGYKSITTIENNTFPLGASGFSFINDLPYIFLPYIGGDYNSKITSDVTYEIFIKTGATYTLEASYVISDPNSVDFSDRFRLWEGTFGTKYIGIRLYTSLFMEEYRTTSSYYKEVTLYDYPYLLEGTYDIDARDNFVISSMSSGYKSLTPITAEYEETKRFETDTASITGPSSGYKSFTSITAEYEETKDFETDTASITGPSSGYKVTSILINT